MLVVVAGVLTERLEERVEQAVVEMVQEEQVQLLVEAELLILGAVEVAALLDRVMAAQAAPVLFFSNTLLNQTSKYLHQLAHGLLRQGSPRSIT